jgi:type II secretory ATPase GspE/PulE/Tfp pilus assembly ATPase PilB-like protein
MSTVIEPPIDSADHPASQPEQQQPQRQPPAPELPRTTAMESQSIIKGWSPDNQLIVGMVEPTNGPAFDSVVRALNLPRRQFERVKITPEEFNFEFNALYRSEGEAEALVDWNSFGRLLTDSNSVQWAGEPGGDEDDDEETSTATATPLRAARTGNLDKALAILEQAQSLGASDIHFMPEGRMGSVRLRIDGSISPSFLSFKKKEFRAMVNTIITRAGLTPEDIQQEKCANSKVKVNANGKPTEYRASFVATEHGISAVLRLNVNVITDINRLGFEPEQTARLRLGIKRSKGIILMVGPTGSGKSNTMEAIITEMNDGTYIIYQIGDPIEFIVDGRYQVPVTNEEELGKAYDQSMRHDPDIICPGEIRTAEQAFQAVKNAQTGHLVMSTLHAGSAAEAVSRLIGLNVDPFYLSDFLIMVIGQRLIPKLCIHCKIKDTANPGEYLINDEGCRYCLHRGVYDRQAICEIMLVTSAIKQLIRNRASTDDIEGTARGEGMLTMQEIAERKIKAGIVARQSVNMELGDLDVSSLITQAAA